MPRDDDVVEDTYTSEQTRTLCGAIIEAIAQYRGMDPHTVDFALYEYIEPDALTRLLQHDTSQNALIQFTADDTQITLYGDDQVEIRVNSIPDEPYSFLE
ncbi:hypothetical protein HUG10_19705 (plasmid) [Halorarum halophilum]|uniref:Halobacterial output domain-containing protein n=1 Tax=Halorarum halophilum TaxID=2743090 RepID=A0A7D5KYG4_9EURY|nr:HalOD1 output domain-containing protein [Halobaculum halophilum]QLG29838.1 hypothetical protein HUG10_19705 [Halobaculum halophilum]